MTLLSAASETETSKVYTEDELSAMTIAQIKALAAELGYSLTKTLKADIIAEFLAQQAGEGS